MCNWNQMWKTINEGTAELSVTKQTLELLLALHVYLLPGIRKNFLF